MILTGFLTCALASLALGSPQAPHAIDSALTPSEDAARQRAPDLFNAVHDAMRQWGSSIHHNGMSFFLATVPEGVMFYHGSSKEETPDQPEWLAYEIEHAELFARSRFGGRPPGPPPGDDGARGGVGWMSFLQGPYDPQRPLSGPPAPPPTEDNGGWLHVYRTTEPLKLLYVDGMGAGKTNMGTLDTQDYVLRGQTPGASGRDVHKAPEQGRGSGPMDERGRANELCDLCNDLGLQGIIRMEAGFEIIKCNFSESMEKVQALHRPTTQGGSSPRPGFGGFEYIRGVAERYEGIGSARTSIDFSSMVSAFFFPVNLTNPDQSRPDLPRLYNTTTTERALIKDYLSTVLEKRMQGPADGVNWQGVSDMIVSRYADRLRYIVQNVTSTQEMEREVSFLLNLFIDGLDEDDEDYSAATQRCTNFYLPSKSHTSEIDQLLQVAFAAVTGTICSTLFTVLQLVSSDGDKEGWSLDAPIQELQVLIDHLGWARFRRCSGCGVDEVCFIPMWPLGKKDDYYHPRCIHGTDLAGGDSYWGGFQRPGPGGRDR